ncbi:Phage integrase family protein [Arenibacter nanhaiticus]|uniref:Phage integrase family protein n=1 Tax=Arenibacter nanhaiticus TaxID=558155 RepID=A0A1M6FCP8_9FLAO|nr:tyrosine-type recombinase/integrase [Arenibacter nanhaiticus]SHI95435.1 Phage integrase family protein [Arenibacter nanhaiticus]
MASIKIVLWKHDQKKDSTFPLAVRITQNRKTRYIFTGKYILEEHWNNDLCRVKKSCPNSARLNNFLLKKLLEVDNIALEAEGSKNFISSSDIKNRAKHKGRAISFFQFGAQRVLNKYQAGVFSVCKSDLSILFNLREFLKWNKFEDRETVVNGIKERRRKRVGRSRKPGYSFVDEVRRQFEKDTTLYFEDIKESFLTNYKIFCISYLNQKTRTVTNQLVFIRTLFNAAIKEGIVDAKYYPFAGEKERIRIKSGHKIGLNREEIGRLENVQLEEESAMWHTRNVWLFSYYFAGIRISDVLQMKWSDLKDGRLYYVMNKNEKPLSLKIPDKAKVILDMYKSSQLSHEDYIFPYLKKANTASKRDIFVKSRNATKTLNKCLKQIAEKCGIKKNLSNHIARHSFGNIAGDAISPLMLQKLYRHSDLQTTINYQANFIHRDADDALDAVLNS